MEGAKRRYLQTGLQWSRQLFGKNEPQNWSETLPMLTFDLSLLVRDAPGIASATQRIDAALQKSTQTFDVACACPCSVGAGDV